MGLKKVLGGLAILAASSVCQAGLMGSGVIANYHYPELGTIIGASATTVTGAYEFTDPTGFPGDSNLFDFIDFGDNFILFDFRSDACCKWTDSDYNGFELIFDLGVLSDLSAATFSPNTGGYVDAMISQAGDTLYINWAGGDITDVASVRVNLEFATVPLPGSMLLVGLGLVALRLQRRSR